MSNTKTSAAARYNEHCEEVAKIIIEKLEKGCAPWQKPWTCEGSSAIPTNEKTQLQYTGGNALYLMIAQESMGFKSNRWLTFKQAKEMGGNIKKGSRGFKIVYWKDFDRLEIDRENDELTHKKSLVPFVFTVFNIEQTEWIESKKIEKKYFKPIEAAENILKNSSAKITEKEGDEAYYNTRTDEIVLPKREQFKTPSDFYDTALHELGHWTGHESRLNRDLTGGFGSENYAKEELRAEIASMMIAMNIGLPHNTEKHSAYVGSWIKVLKKDPKEIFRAAKDAEKIKNFIIGMNK